MLQARYVVVLLVCLSLPATAGDPLSLSELQHELDSILDESPVTRRTTVCLKVVDVVTGKVVFDRGGDRLLTPASNLKIYTAACALDQLGPQKRFGTELRAAGSIDNGTLQGDLVLVGGGDSMLTSADLENLVSRAVKQWSLRRILGSIRVDNSRYGSPLKGPGWMWDDEPADFNMSVTPLMVDFNVLNVRVTASGKNLSATLVPTSAYPPIHYAAQQHETQQVRVLREAFRDQLIVTPGNLDDASQDFRLTMHAPGPWAAGLLRHMLTRRGVTIQETESPAASLRPQASGANPTVSVRHEGLTLAEAVSHLLQVSENAVGEVLFHEIAVSGGKRQPSWSDGADVITNWLTEEAGLVPGSFRLVDGSGLSRYNLISADSSVRLLRFMHRHPHFNVFFRSLKTYQVDLDSTEKADSESYRVHAKSGGMTGVSTISGYVRTRDGQLLTFSFLANGYLGSNTPVFELRDSVWRALVRYR